LQIKQVLLQSFEWDVVGEKFMVLLKVLFWNMAGGTEEIHQNLQSGWYLGQDLKLRPEYERGVLTIRPCCSELK
jgi:hypothetical protein